MPPSSHPPRRFESTKGRRLVAMEAGPEAESFVNANGSLRSTESWPHSTRQSASYKLPKNQM